MAVESLLTALVIPLIRNVTGWLENSLEDGKIQKYEVKELVTTIIKLGAPVAIAYAGVQLGDLNEAITMITALAVVGIDWIYSKIKPKSK